MEPNQSMNMLRHHHKAKVASLLVSQLHGKLMDDNAFCLVVVQQFSPFGAGEGYEIGVTFTAKDLTPQTLIVLHALNPNEPSCPTGTGNELPVSPCVISNDCPPGTLPMP
jgi:hypothetical protein